MKNLFFLLFFSTVLQAQSGSISELKSQFEYYYKSDKLDSALILAKSIDKILEPQKSLLIETSRAVDEAASQYFF